MMMDKIPILKRRAEQQSASTANSKSDDNTNNTSTTSTTPNNTANTYAKDPICVIVVGMAGSGKTTLMAQLQKSLNLKARDKKEEDNKKSSSAANDDKVDVSYLMCVVAVVMCIYICYIRILIYSLHSFFYTITRIPLGLFVCILV